MLTRLVRMGAMGLWTTATALHGDRRPPWGRRSPECLGGG